MPIMTRLKEIHEQLGELPPPPQDYDAAGRALAEAHNAVMPKEADDTLSKKEQD
jgi:hypothetical protein